MIWYGLAVALATGCGRSGSPAPEAAGPGAAVTTIVPTAADAQLTHVIDLVRGRVPGLEVQRLPNGHYTLRIRGREMGGDEPLLVIDGVPVPEGSLGATLASLAPRDVARIDVFRDAAGTARYGPRAAHGAIAITTKRAP